MTNFVNFITDKIRPPIIQAYLDGPGTDQDFIGNDSSTMDYSKFGYIAAVYRKMLRSGKATPEVKQIVTYVANLDNDGDKNYKTISSSGYDISDMTVFDARNDPFFSVNELADAVGDADFFDYYVDVARKPVSSGMGSAIHMMVEFQHNIALQEMPSSAFAYSEEDEKQTIGPYMYALKRAADSDMESSRLTTFNIINDKVSNEPYNVLYGPNPSSLNGETLKNEMSMFLMSASSESIGRSIDILVGRLDDALEPSANINAVVKATGLSKNSIEFNASLYEAAVSNDKDKGYSPLFYYVNRFKSSADASVLAKLSSKFSSFAISVVDGQTEGFNPLSVMSASLSIGANGEWENEDIVAWFLSETSKMASLDGYTFFAASGNVRDNTGGEEINDYGVVSNALKTINVYHKEYNANKEDGAPAFDPSPLLSKIFPSCIDSQFYAEWMVEFGQEVD